MWKLSYLIVPGRDYSKENEERCTEVLEKRVRSWQLS
jgi:hypothetical protein